MANAAAPRIVIVGGGAGGLELATRLGDRLGRRGAAQITLIDRAMTHIWKPLLHEVAAGVRDASRDELDYLAQGHWHHFRFRVGTLQDIDRDAREVVVAPLRDAEGREVTPLRRFPYDLLVIAVGSTTNSFGTPGASEFCSYLDSHAQAERFYQRFLESLLRAHAQHDPLTEGQLGIAIIGAGATGIELSAELHRAVRALVAFGLDRIAPGQHVRFTLIEAGTRLLPALPEKLSDAVAQQLERLGIELLLGERVTEVTAEAVLTQSGRKIPAATKVWAAGIKAPDFLNGLGGLETNRIDQLVVRPTLLTTRDENIFAIGDCAACPQPGTDEPVPPRAQAAHQQASHVYRNIRRRLAGKPMLDYAYRDFGSLVSLSGASTVGNLMGNLTGNVMISGTMARFVYWSLHQMHLQALHGTFRTALMMLVNWLMHRTQPRLKLH